MRDSSEVVKLDQTGLIANIQSRVDVITRLSSDIRRKSSVLDAVVFSPMSESADSSSEKMDTSLSLSEGIFVRFDMLESNLMHIAEVLDKF